MLTSEQAFKILIPIGCRSDEGLILPVIRRLERDPAFSVKVIRLVPMNFIESYRIAEDAIREFKPDLFFANADRVEMCGATAAAFHNKVKIAHYQAGVVNDPITTFDDIDRHVITLWSDIQFCETESMACMVAALLQGWKGSDEHVVGITHLDDLEVDESKVPEEPYDLVLLNFTPFERNSIIVKAALDAISKNTRRTIVIGGNPDGELRLTDSGDYSCIPNLPRTQFLGLLKNCTRFITNSSCATTEAPFFLREDQIIQVGDRNRNRPNVSCVPGGSDRIVKILKEIAEEG